MVILNEGGRELRLNVTKEAKPILILEYRLMRLACCWRLCYFVEIVIKKSTTIAPKADIVVLISQRTMKEMTGLAKLCAPKKYPQNKEKEKAVSHE